MKKKLVLAIVMLSMSASILSCGKSANATAQSGATSVSDSASDANETQKQNTETSSQTSSETEGTSETKESTEGKTPASTQTSAEEQQPANAQDASAQTSVNNQDVFTSFITGSTNAIVGADFISSLSYICTNGASEPGENMLKDLGTISIDTLKTKVDESETMDLSKEERYYTVMQTASGTDMLVVKFQNLGIYGPDDGSCAYFVFAAVNGELHLTYAIDSWARSYVELCDGLVFKGAGSGGAGDSMEWCDLIDESGQCKTVYSLETLYEDWVAMSDYDDFGSDTSWSQGCTYYLLKSSDGNYYSYEVPDTVDQEKLATLNQYQEAQGFVKVDDVQSKISEACTKYNVVPNSLTAFEGWTKM